VVCPERGEQVCPPPPDDVVSVAVTVYWVIALAPLDEGGDHETLAEASPALATTFVGAPGTSIPVALIARV
jgi:hypothetical protein